MKTGKDKKTIYVDGEPIKEPPLLTIELENESSVPKVFYKGEEIKWKDEIRFRWSTKRELPLSGGVDYLIQHFVKGNQNIQLNKIGLSTGKYMSKDD
ncbi:hypothetical protein SAMN05216389_1445 [Oceanobacillus limi]|uniref:Uncharacterized protein n=1 Tax=Oceanobacillus limi TaxID=930131 RepID=A0A1I0HPE8_9BACI|nr:hypothetical protein [Oceanobacillus limi]SET85890.1 hypothetical protein SAMN05216389_1445 [Oceanobacillus limi]